NILGRDLEAAQALAAEGHEGVHVHIYGKRESRPLRKMGHVTFVGTDAAAYAARWADRFEK
ncbi:MAG: 5-(carboxyamino)imidazole ribonucleotide synthase, partial [Alistipes sp.]|nr:5-(carboxyamino)imidazole ribonucleotide synthase [Alistipes sp.]